MLKHECKRCLFTQRKCEYKRRFGHKMCARWMTNEEAFNVLLLAINWPRFGYSPTVVENAGVLRGGVIYVLEELSYRYPRLFAVHSWFIWCKTWAVIGLMLFFFFQTATRWRQTQCISSVTLVVTRRIYNRYQWVLLYCRSPDVDATLVAILC